MQEMRAAWYHRLRGRRDWSWRAMWRSGPRVGHGIDRGVWARSADLLGGARLARLGGSSVGVSFNWRESGIVRCAGLTLAVWMGIGFRRIFARAEYARQRTRTRHPGFIAWRNRVLSIENQNARSWYSEVSESRVLSTENENTRSRYSEALGSRVLSTAIENAQSQWFSVDYKRITRSRTLGWVGDASRVDRPAFIPGRSPTAANRQPVLI